MKVTSFLRATLAFLIIAGCSGKKQENSSSLQQTTPVTAHNYSDSVNKGIIVVDSIKKSPACTAMSMVGNNHVHIVYASPGVRGRVIWGELVPYGKVWVTGAHNATSIDFSKDIQVGDQKVPAGKYAFFTIPGADEWTLILNRNFNQHLADKYSATEDVVRITVKPEVQQTSLQRLAYSIEAVSDQEGKVVVQWEKIMVALPFKNAN